MKKKIIFWYFLVFLWSITRKYPENLKKQSVSIIVSIFVKKISPNNVRDFFFLLFIREKKICLWTLWNFSWPSATRNFKIGFTRKCSSHSWTGEKRSLTVGEIFFTQKRDNYTNKVLFLLLSSQRCQIQVSIRTNLFQKDLGTTLKLCRMTAWRQKYWTWLALVGISRPCWITETRQR